jgi:hypothetical protein
MADILMCLELDTTELQYDLERIERGELSTPTVSSVSVLFDDDRIEEIPIYLEGT